MSIHAMPVKFKTEVELLTAHNESPVSTVSTCSIHNEKLTDGEVLRKWRSGVHLFQFELND
jgi:hypothetical protein